MTVQELFEASKKLTYAERSELAELLFEDLHPPREEMSKDELVVELNRRAKELEENPELAIPFETVIQRGRELLKKYE